MSVIKNIVAMPNRIDAIYQWLLQRGERGEVEEKLLAYLCPPAFQQKAGAADEEQDSSATKTTIGEGALREAILLGVVEKYTHNEQERLRLTEPLRKRQTSLHAHLEEALLVPERANTAGQQNFPKVLAWLLMQDTSTPLNFSAMPAQEIREMFGEERFTSNNNATMQNFYYWARYLGFSYWIEVSNVKGVYPDPTNFFERHLPALLRDQGEVRLQDVMASLARRYPSFEGGIVREDLEDLIDSQHRRATQELSPSTSLTLRRLERKKIIRLKEVADAPKMTLLTWPEPTQASHIVLGGKEA